MILLASSLIGKQVLTLRAGAPVGEVTGILVDPHKLKVSGFWVKLGKAKEDGVLLEPNIRDMSVRGIIVNDVDDVADPEDLPALKEILEIDYHIPGKKIVAGRKRLGTAEDFGFTKETFEIANFIGKPSLMSRFNQSQINVMRSQVAGIDDTHIRVKDEPLGAKIRSDTSKKRRGKLQTEASSSSTND